MLLCHRGEELKILPQSAVTGTLVPFAHCARFSAQALNAHYAATASRHPPATDHDFEAIIHQNPTPSLNTPFYLCPFSRREVTETLQRATSKSTGHDGLSVPMLKLIAPHSLTHIINLHNTSIGTATFPESWMRAIIKSLAKTKALTQPSDTRPIAQLPELSKVLERVVHNQLQGYLEANHLLHPRQTALLGVFDDIRHAIDKRMLLFHILFDFSKAFDSIPHAILQVKLRAEILSTDALRWFFTYLADRLQAVIDSGGKVSDWLRASSGVPRRSVLGPLPFAIYINEHPAVVPLRL